LQRFLNAMGAKIMGAGTDTITIDGVKKLSACRYKVIPDRIVAGTIMVAAAATRGSVTLQNTRPAHLSSLIHVLRRVGVQIVIDGDIIKIDSAARPKSIERIVTSPY